jgi:hypothetical protein
MSDFFHALLFLILAIFADTGSATLVSTTSDIDNAGFIHGQVTLHSGEIYEGFLRWKDEEAYWDDLFHSQQSELPWLEHVDMEELQKERKRRYFQTHGMFDRLMWTLHHKDGDLHMSRLFICQFGYLDGIAIDEEENVTVRLRGGEVIPVHGYSNDVSSDLLVYSADGDPVEVGWDELADISFSAAPDDAVPYARRLFGAVESTEGTFEGFIQWDMSECTSIDMLDGNNQEIPMGDIRSITKNRKGNSDIVLKNGEAFSMAGTNDVGGGNRGVMVENAAWGCVTVAWKRFQSITFADGHGSGTGRGEFPEIAPLTGTVTGSEGQTRTGRIVYDMDEAWTRDLFNGAVRDLEYDIPFGLINSIEKRDDENCRVSLVTGQVLDLTKSQDTGAKHAGVLVFENGHEEARYIPWSGIESITFDR